MAGLDGDATSSTIYIDDLIATNPESGDAKSQGDDHLRFIKKVLKNTFANITGQVTADQSELNILDGATLTTTELNTLDGVVGTLTAAELNMLDGIGTTTVATQLAAKAPIASPTFTGTVILPSTTSIGDVSDTELAVLNGITSTTEELNVLAGITATTAELNILDGVTANTEELNVLDGVTITTAQLNAPVLMTKKDSTSGTSIDFTSIPAWAKRITVMLAGVSTDGTAAIKLQIGDSGGLEASGYVATRGIATSGNLADCVPSTDSWQLSAGAAAGDTYSGQVILTNLNGNTWVAQGQIFADGSTERWYGSAGYKTLSAALDRLSIVSTDTFDAGMINVMYD